MSLRLYRLLQAFILLALCIFLIAKLTSGKLSLYINMRFMPLTVFGIAMLAIMGMALAARLGTNSPEDDHREDSNHSHNISLSALAILTLPLLIGILIPSRPLDASAASTRGMNVSAPLIRSSSQTRQFEAAADTRNILDWIRIFNSNTDLAPYLGQTAKVTGFVYHDPRLPANQFIVSRFVITCCAADASAIGMIVTWNESSALKESDWVEVKGPVQSSQLGGQPIPLIAASLVQSVQQPGQPYLYP
jgi:putative membrane protein